jgi:hypothetical protein
MTAQIQQNASDAIRTHVLDELIYEVEVHLQSLKYPHDLPGDFRRTVIEGWADSNRKWTVCSRKCFLSQREKTWKRYSRRGK